jgi:sulfur carrier protein
VNTTEDPREGQGTLTVGQASQPVRVRLNGCWRELPAGSSVADLVAGLGAGTRRIAIERNGRIVPRSQWAECVLATGDCVEAVGAVGGG